MTSRKGTNLCFFLGESLNSGTIGIVHKCSKFTVLRKTVRISVLQDVTMDIYEARAEKIIFSGFIRESSLPTEYKIIFLFAHRNSDFIFVKFISSITFT